MNLEQHSQKEPSFKDSIRMPLMFVGALWVIESLHTLLGLDFRGLGIFPMRLSGLWGILTAPLVHSDFAHLFSNSVPFLMLGTLIVHFYRKVALSAFFLIYMLTGAAVWLLGREVYHLGASGVVYGMVAFVFWTGILTRNPISIVLTLIVTFLYSGMFLGILPNQEGVSWESHLFGAISGMYCAFLFRNELEEETSSPDNEEDEEGKVFFFDRDTFTDQRMEDELLDDYSPKPPSWQSSSTWENSETQD